MLVVYSTINHHIARENHDGELVLDRAGLLLVDLGVEQVADNALEFVLTLHGSRYNLVEGGLQEPSAPPLRE